MMSQCGERTSGATWTKNHLMAAHYPHAGHQVTLVADN